MSGSLSAGGCALGLSLVLGVGCAREHAGQRPERPGEQGSKPLRCVTHWVSSGILDGVPELYVNGARGPRDPQPLVDGDSPGDRGFDALGTVDFSGDGAPDLVLRSYYYGAAVICETLGFSVLRPGAGAALAWPREGGASQSCELGRSGLAPLGDFDGDGRDDLALQGHVFMRGAEAGWSKHDEYCPRATGLGDVDGDGVNDSACSPITGSDENVWVVWGGDGVRTAIVARDPNSLGVSIVAAGDIDADGFDDFVVGDGSDAHRLFLGGPRAQVGERHMEFPASPSNRFVVGPGDVNGDGFDDLLLSGPEGGRLLIGARLAVGPTGDVGQLRPSTALRWPPRDTFDDRLWPAGDANCDGYADVLARSGRGVELYLGSASGLAETPAWSFAAQRLDPVFVPTASPARSASAPR